MRSGFADTSFFVAFLNARDVDHAKAVALMKDHLGPIVMTDWVLAELGNYLSAKASRDLFVPFVRNLPADRRMEIVPGDREQFTLACDRYAARPDKAWSLTDCISMLVLERLSIQDVFTADHHFEKAGYTILMK